MKCFTAFALFIVITSNFRRIIAKETIDETKVQAEVISLDEGAEWIVIRKKGNKGRNKGKGKSKSKTKGSKGKGKSKSNSKSKGKGKGKGNPRFPD